MADFKLFSRLAAIKKWLDGIHPAIVGIILLIFFLSLTLPTYNYTSAGGDMGEYINNPVRVIHGDLPYRDFWLLFPPGEVYLPALLYMVFGINANVLLAWLTIVSALTGLAAYALARETFSDNVLSAAAAILVFVNGMTAPYMLLLLVAAFFIVRSVKAGGRKYLAMSGIFTGLGFLFRFHEVGAALLAFVVALAAYMLLEGQKPREILEKACILCLIAFALPLIIMLPLIAAWPQTLYDTTIQTVLQGSALRIPYFPDYRPYVDLAAASLGGFIGSGGPRQLKDAVFYALEGLNIYSLYLLPLIVALAAIYFAADRSSKSHDKAIIILFTLWGVFTFPKVVWRADLPHLTQAITPLFFALICMARMGLKKEKAARYLSYVLAIVLLIVLLHACLAIKSSVSVLLGPQPDHGISTQYGSLRTWDGADAADVNGLIAYIGNNTVEGDYIFVTPWNSSPLYELTGRKDPTYYDSLIDPIARPSVEKQEQICQGILSKDTKLIVSYPDWGFDNKAELQFANACPIVEKCIEDNFKPVAQYGPYIVYAPLNGSAASGS